MVFRGRWGQPDPTNQYVQNNPVNFVDPDGLFATQIALKGINAFFRYGNSAQEIAIQARVADSLLGPIATAYGIELPPDIRNKEIKGCGSVTIGNAVDAVTAYAGWQTFSLGVTIASTKVGLSSGVLAAVSGSAAATGGSILLAFLGGYEIGTAINNSILENRLIFEKGNPATRFTFWFYDKLNP
jgi:hypothetical protein